MPLKCLLDGSAIFAFDFEQNPWDELRRENKSRKHLALACCDAQVTLRTSKLGTRHFAHTRRGECSTVPETAEHLLAKQRIIEGVRRAGWGAYVEQAGETLNHEAWIADVIAQKGSARVALEVQWSRQENSETVRRQARYKESGVRGIWFLRQLNIPLGKAVPAFRLVFDESTSEFSVFLPTSRYEGWLSTRTLAEPQYWQEPVELSRFVEGALTGKLIFAPAFGKVLPLEVHTAPVDCWKCKKETQLVISLIFRADQAFPGCANIELDIYDLEEMAGGPELLMNILPPREIVKHGIGAVKPRFSKTLGGHYISNGCVHCDALQGKFFDHEVAYMAQKAFQLNCELKAEWRNETEKLGSANRWWFDIA